VVLQRVEGDELVRDDFDPDEAADEQQVAAGARDAEQEGDWVADVAEDELEGEVVVAVEVDVAAPPGEQAVDEAEEGDDDVMGVRDVAVAVAVAGWGGEYI